MNQQELLEKYFAGELNEEETAKFNELNESDSEFKEEVSFYNDLKIVVLEDERRRLKSILSNPKANNITNNRKLKRIILIGLSLLLILAILFTYRYIKTQNSPPILYAAYFDAYPNTYRPVSRNALNTNEKQGFTAYENGNFKLASEKFAKSLNETQDPSIIFYQGICFGKMDKIELAIENMEQLKSSDFPYSSQIYWYLGLYYLKQNDINNSILHFQKYIDLSKDNDNKVLKAKVILEKIN